MVESPLVWSLGYVLVTGSKKKLKPTQLINPPIVAILLGFFFLITGIGNYLINETEFIFPIFSALRFLGSTTFPLILISLGAMMAEIEIQVIERRKLLFISLGVGIVRFLFLPATFFLSYFLFLKNISFLTPTHIFVLFIEAHIPPATNVAIMVKQAHINEPNTAFTTLITFALYLIILPIYLSIFLSII
jgi:predicted permease